MINAEEHLPMVNKISCDLFKQFHFKYDWQDLFQMGCVGLMKAVNKFDESKGYKFSSYAYMTIKGTITRDVNEIPNFPAVRAKRNILFV